MARGETASPSSRPSCWPWAPRRWPSSPRSRSTRWALGTAAASVAAAAVIARRTRVRPVDGLLGFGLVLLFTETVAFWTGVDVRFGDEVGVLRWA